MDDPELTNRLWEGPSPTRMVLDMQLRLPSSLKIFDGKTRTIIFNGKKQEEKDSLLYYQLSNDKSIVKQIIQAAYQLNIQSIIVEGGAKLLQSFIDEESWDEIRKITNTSIIIPEGLPAPLQRSARKISEMKILQDLIEIYNPMI